jgi:arylsulfatase
MGPRIAAVLVGCVAVLAAAGCDRAGGRVEIDLTTLGSGDIEGRRGPLPVAGEPGARHLVQAPSGTLDLFLRLPPDAVLHFVLAPPLPAANFAVSVRGAKDEAMLTPSSRTMGEWQAGLAPFAGEPVRLRLENRSQQAIAWVRPRVVGIDARLAATFPPEVRPRTRPINVILYVADAMRADHLSLYGYHRPTSPALAALVERGIVVEHAYATGPSTPNSIPSLFASRYPSEIGPMVREGGAARITLAEAFRAAGYRTAAFTANPLMLQGFGYARGFEHYEIVPYHEEAGGSRRPAAAEVHARVLGWLERQGTQPCFVYVHTMDTHDPYEPPPPFRGRFASAPGGEPREVRAPREKTAEMRRVAAERFLPLPGVRERLDPDRYDESIAYVDHEIGALAAGLQGLGMAARTAFVVTADHGEALGPEDDGTYLHSHSVFEELVRVPLVLVLPWLEGTRRVADPTSLLDLGPTLLDLAGLAVPGEFVGRSLLAPRAALQPPAAVGERLEPPWNQGPVKTPGRSTVAEWFAREGPWKLILDRERAWLFHLPSDPKEMTDLSARRPDQVGYLTSVVRRTSPAFDDGAASGGEVGVDAAERQRLNDALRTLGYVQ